MRIEPAALAFDGDGTPYSPSYGDVYHSGDSGPGQARHVFLEGNGLPRRWAGTRNFTILEAGFGLGLNFLATWRQWRDDPARSERLHYVAIEKHPFARDALAALHQRYPEFAPLAEELRRAWPLLVSGLHRLHFEAERLTLTLAFGDAAELMRGLRLQADAIYLDGFAPRCNADMWSPQLLRGLARFARPGTSVATYSSAAAVREGLEAAGFEVEKRPGFSRKRDMLRGVYAPRWPSRRKAAAAPAATERHAIVVGAGLAGAAVSERLMRRGWRIDLIESRVMPVGAPPARYAGVFHPHLSRDDCFLSRASRNGFLYALSRWSALAQAGGKLVWDRCGVLQLAGEGARDQGLLAAVAAQGLPGDFAQYLERGEAEARAGCRLPGGGWWFSGGGWMRPLSLIAAQLAAGASGAGGASALRLHAGVVAQGIVRSDDDWQVLGADGSLIAAAPILVLANSNDLTRLAGIGQALQRIRGQISYVPAAALRAPQIVLAGAGYLLPAIDECVVVGSTYDRDDADPEPQLRSHESNLRRLAHLLPDAAQAPEAATLQGDVGFRCVAPDRMPLVGAMPDIAAAAAQKAALTGAHLADLPRVPGLYCASAYASRGLVWSELAGEMLASLLEGEPAPLEADLADALDPGRFLLKQLRRGLVR